MHSTGARFSCCTSSVYDQISQPQNHIQHSHQQYYCWVKKLLHLVPSQSGGQKNRPINSRPLQSIEHFSCYFSFLQLSLKLIWWQNGLQQLFLISAQTHTHTFVLVFYFSNCKASAADYCRRSLLLITNCPVLHCTQVLLWVVTDNQTVTQLSCAPKHFHCRRHQLNLIELPFLLAPFSSLPATQTNTQVHFRPEWRLISWSDHVCQ